MNDELDSPKLKAEETTSSAEQKSPTSEKQVEAQNESMHDAILEEHSEEHIVDHSKLDGKSLTELVEEASKVLVLTPKAASTQLGAIRSIFNSAFKQAKAEAETAFKAEQKEGDETPFVFEHEDLKTKIFEISDQIKQAQKEEKERIESEKKKNLNTKHNLLNELEELVKQDETSESIDKVKDIQRQWKAIRVIPKEEVSKLWDRYHLLLDQFYDNHSINIELKELDRKKNLEIKIELTKKVEEIANEPSLKKSFILLNKYHEDFKHAGSVPRESREAIWNAFKKASDSIYEQKRKVYETLEASKGDNLKKKEILVEKAQLLNQVEPKTAKDWNKRYEDFEKLFADWKKIGPVPKSNKDQVWIAFNGVRNDFYTKRKSHFKEVNSERKANLKAKEELCAKVEELKDSTDWAKTAKQIIAYQNDWKKVGPVPDKVNQAIWKRFRAACDHFFNARSKVFEGQRAGEEQNLKAKEALLAQLDTILNSDLDYKKSFEALKKVSAEWKTIGYVPHKAVKRINTSYDKSSNAIFNKYKEEAEKHKASNLKEHYHHLKETANGDRVLENEMRQIKKKISGLNAEIASIETNMSFFAKSKTADKLLKDFENKIAKINKQISSLKTELSAIRSAQKEVNAESEESADTDQKTEE
jgi:hypothetical protein